MRVAISTDSKDDLESVVSPHFGRCPYFCLVDVEDRRVTNVTAVDNPFYGMHRPGQVPAFIRQQGATVMLTGGMGGRAIQFFQQMGIEAVTGAAGTVRLSMERFLGGELEGAAPCRTSEDHGYGEQAGEQEYEQDEVGRLREEVEMLRAQLGETMTRLGELGGEDK